jgi:methanogenic corrinoid protein MtbC1
MSVPALENLKRAILDYDAAGAARWAKAALEAGVAPLDAFGALTEALREVGDGFGRGELWLPDLVGASDAMLAAAPYIEEAIKHSGAQRQSAGTIVIGTVQGDLHSIGKAMVATLLTADGFTVHDLGIDVSAEQFVQAVEKYQPDILAMSALMTTTAPQQREVLRRLTERSLRQRVKVIVGGGGTTAEFAQSIGADGYDPTAPGAVTLCRRLLGR